MQISHAQFSFNRSRMHLGILRQFLRIPQKCCGDDINDRCQDDDSLDDINDGCQEQLGLASRSPSILGKKIERVKSEDPFSVPITIILGSQAHAASMTAMFILCFMYSTSSNTLRLL